uniref:Probable periplasmic serine endoprotease DegP-like n=1 Tax=uncultured bacterium UPO53 TaxID=1776978 RepID=A0A126SYE5_9BACT|nr:serine protease MucD precursor [uncultured bacterium UPO53]
MLSQVKSVALGALASVAFLFVAPAQAELPDFAPLAEMADKAVVNISASAKASTRVGQQDVPEIFRRFFGDDFNFAPAPQDRQSFGSGFIISADGYVLTNNHVVAGADKVVVKLADRRELDAEVVGTDERSDVALLKIDAKDLPTLRIGNPDNLKVGEWVMAIGSPYGFEYSVTAGIVSAKSRSLPNESYVPFIQTDVAINPGNSGGPLLNLKGEVVGINSQIYSRSGGFMGLSFAIPIDVAMESVEQLKASGHVTRGYLGVVIQDITRDLADAYSLPRPAGALVSRVMPDSPAAKAGIKEGDVITQFNGHDINLSSDLPQLVGRAKVGQSYPLTVYRDGKARTMDFLVAALPDDDDDGQVSGPAGKGKSAKPDLSRLGINSIRDLSAEEKAALKIDGGAVLMQLSAGAATDAGLRPGDVIVSLQNKPVTSAKQFVDMAQTLPAGKAVPVGVNRRGQPLILALRLEAPPADSGKKK